MKKQKEPQFSIKAKQVLVFVVLVLVLYIIVPSGKLTGAAISYPCMDTDDGAEYNVKGFVDYNGRIYEDYCYGNTHMKEYYCNVNWMYQRHHRCENGCFDGACL